MKVVDVDESGTLCILYPNELYNRDLDLAIFLGFMRWISGSPRFLAGNPGKKRRRMKRGLIICIMSIIKFAFIQLIQNHLRSFR